MDECEKFLSVCPKNAGNTLCINEAFWAKWREFIRSDADNTINQWLPRGHWMPPRNILLNHFRDFICEVLFLLLDALALFKANCVLKNNGTAELLCDSGDMLLNRH